MAPKLKKKKKTHQKLALTSLKTPSPPSHYAFALTQIAVSQICKSLGFTTTNVSALQTLTRITTLFLQTLAKTAVSYSNHCSRTHPNLSDIVHALHDLAAVHGFAGASLLHQTHNPFCSSVLKDLRLFVNRSKEIPFVKPIPRRSPTGIQVPAEVVKRRRGMHIPEWLPHFPEESDRECKGNECERGVGGELVRWERSSTVHCDSGGGGDGVKSGGGGGELGAERGRVRFRVGGGENERKEKGWLGVQRRNVVCIGGKRVCWNYLVDDHGESQK